MTPRDRIEAFHLLFLRALTAQLDDRARVILKGGCNLRFYFGSPRFSEDMDLDVRTIAARTLARKVDGILSGIPFTRVLGAHGIRIESWSAPKQTETVQRWKAALSDAEGGVAEPTKVEFSRRKAGDGVVEPIPAAVLDRLRLPGPVLAAHYAGEDAIKQKAEALVGRDSPQARDVFDIHWLLSRGVAVPPLERKLRVSATERVMEFTSGDFEAQVVAYLEPEEQAHWRDRAVIESMQLRVVEAFER